MPTYCAKNNNKNNKNNYNKENKEQENYVFSGKRIKRGLYQTQNNLLVNADINGAANILRKVFPKVKQWDSGIVGIPVIAFFVITKPPLQTACC